MKFILIGLHGSGKHEIAHTLQEMGVKYGKNFTSVDLDLSKAYGEFEYYENSTVNDVFENNAFIFLHEHQGKEIPSSYKYFEGLSKYTFDNNDVFVMSPNQFLSIPANNMPDDVVWVWLDNTKTNRSNRYKMEKRSYDFMDREDLEKQDIKEFVKALYNVQDLKLLYFTNEDPARVATIIYYIQMHPDLLNHFIKNFN